MSTAPVAKLLALAALLSAVFHLVWENAQAPLFAGYQNFWQHFWICLRGTTGDVAITLAVYVAVAALVRNGQWVNTIHAPGVAGLALAGALIAVGIERQALVSGRWAYTAAMPLVPYFSVGLTPVLQMAILLPLTFLVSRKLSRLIV